MFNCYLTIVMTFITGNTVPVTLLKTPHGGIQPQALVDAHDTLHLLYFQGDPKAGNLYYVRKLSSEASFTPPMRVNSVANSSIAIGTVRGGQIAMGKAGRIHVAWNGAGPEGGMCYTRLNDDATAFEDQRNLMKLTSIPDGGCTLAADAGGHVIVAWHAVKTGDKGEDLRHLWLRRSRDEGKSFANEVPAWQEPTGACGCCSTRGFADQAGAYYFLYRSAKNRDQRDIYLLTSTSADASCQGKLVHPWKITTCPMSTLSLAQGPQGVVAAWDTAGQVYTTTIKPGTTRFTAPQAAPGLAHARKHPTLAINARGHTLLAWTEGTGWQRGGDLLWQMYDAEGNPIGSPGRLDKSIPVWGLPTAVATRSGFILIH